MKKYMLFILFFVIHFTGTPSDAALIHFQDLVNNGTLPIGTVICDQFASDGVLFSVEAVQSSTYPGPISDGFGTYETCGMFNTFNYSEPIIADFTVAVDHVSFCSIANSPLTAIAYNSLGDIIGNTTILDGTLQGEINTLENIDFISFLNNSGTGFYGRKDLTIVSYLDFSHSSSPVSEPPTIPLLVAGLFMIGCISKKRML